ncbi:MAG: hypothetical protein ACJ8C4_00560 [Gemmataceae bacterium]
MDAIQKIRLRATLGVALNRIRRDNFTDAMRLTLVVRDPDNAECELVITDDDIVGVADSIHRSQIRAGEAFSAPPTELLMALTEIGRLCKWRGGHPPLRALMAHEALTKIHDIVAKATGKEFEQLT